MFRFVPHSSILPSFFSFHSFLARACVSSCYIMFNNLSKMYFFSCWYIIHLILIFYYILSKNACECRVGTYKILTTASVDKNLQWCKKEDEKEAHAYTHTHTEWTNENRYNFFIVLLQLIRCGIRLTRIWLQKIKQGKR